MVLPSVVVSVHTEMWIQLCACLGTYACTDAEACKQIQMDNNNTWSDETLIHAHTPINRHTACLFFLRPIVCYGTNTGRGYLLLPGMVYYFTI